MATDGKTGWRKGWLVLLVLIALIVAGGAFLLLPQLRERDKLYYNKGKLNLDAGNSVAALENFRTALKLNPQFLEAQVGVVQALAARRDFADAQTELAKAVEMGYPKGESAMLKAKLLADRATYRLDSAGTTLDPALCETVMSEDMDPAIAAAQQNADATAKPGRSYNQLGDLLMQKSKIYGRIWELHLKQGEHYKAMGRGDLADEESKASTDALTKLGQSQQDAMAAYGKAIELDPGMVSPRLAIAEQALTTYVPQPERARKVLEPIFETSPDHRRGRLLMASVERQERHYDEALKQVAAARPQGEKDYELTMARAQILNDAGRFEDLLSVSDELLSMRPTDAWPRFLRGRALLMVPETDPEKRKAAVQEAATDLQLIFRKVKNWPLAHLLLAQASTELGNQLQARSAYREALDDVDAIRPPRCSRRAKFSTCSTSRPRGTLQGP